MHFGILHLVFNMFWLADLGAQFEMLRKSWRLAGFVVGAAIFSNLAQYLWHGPGFGGMSGVVYALFGYTWMKAHFEPNTKFRLNTGAVPTMLIWLFLCMTGALGPIANAAHLAGLVFGVVAGALPHARDIVRSW
jgi:GlpG protein